MSKDFKDNILNYEKSIKSMSSFRDAVRRIPGMYIGGDGDIAHINMIREIFQNSIDEGVKRSSPCNWIKLTYNESNKMTIVEDNGRGIPFSLLGDIFTKEHTSSNYEKELYDYSSGTHGLGSKITCALSSMFSVKSHILGKCKSATFIDGILTKEGIVDDSPDREQGTTISFIPYENLGRITTDCEKVRTLITNIIQLTPIGTIIEFNGIDKNGNLIYDEVFKNEMGIDLQLSSILSDYKLLNNNITINNDNGEYKIDIALNFNTNIENDGIIVCYANFTPTRGGTHLDGFINGVVKFFRNYMNKIYLNDKSKVTVTPNDIKMCLNAVVSISVLNPIWQGQSKDFLGNDDLIPYLTEFINDYFNKWSQNNPKDLQKIGKLLKSIAELRLKSENSKINLSKQYKKTFTGLPEEYKKPSSRKNLELLIVEGKSALGPVINARNQYNQGVFPIRGKLPNAFEKTRESMLANSEVAAIIEIIGCGYGKNCNIENCKFDKIIFLTDADPDGAHISGLLLNLFALYLRPLIEAGKVYKALPPLFGMEVKNKMKYFTDKAEHINYVKNLFVSNNNITVNGNKLTGNEVFDIIYNNSEYIYELERLSRNYAVPPILMEAVLMGYINGTKPINTYNYLKKKYYRFLENDTVNNNFIINGLAGEMYIELILSDNLFKDSFEVINILKLNKNFTFEVNGNEVTIYDFMKIYKSYEPASLQRYKGLGEMEPYQLKDSTLSLDNRTLIQYTTESLEFEINQMRLLSDNRLDLIKNINMKRSELI